MKKSASEDAGHAIRARREFRLISLLPLLFCGGFLLGVFLTPNLFRELVFAAAAIAQAFFFANTWNDGDHFYQRWMKLREDCLRDADAAERRLL